MRTTTVRMPTRVDHALRALVALIGASADQPCKLAAVVERAPAPTKFLAMILADLRHAGLVDSSRGAHGGYWLAQAPEDISVLAVVRGLEAAVDVPEPASQPATAGLDELWGALEDQASALLASVSLADLAGGRVPARVAAVLRSGGASSPKG